MPQRWATAVAEGAYGSWAPNAAERARLEQIFPQGVCDWDRGDLGSPEPPRRWHHRAAKAWSHHDRPDERPRPHAR